MADGARIVALAQQQIGQPYVWGGEDPGGFDCSGLVQFVFEQAGMKLPRTARQQQDAVKQIDAGEAQPGDLVFWGDPAHHVGIYVGGGQVLDAPRSGARVKVRKVWGSPTYGRPQGLLSRIGDALIDPFNLADKAKDAVPDVGGAFQGAADGLLAGSRDVVVKGAFALLAVGLIGVGAYQTTRGGGR